MGIIVHGQELDAPAGLVVKNFKDPSVVRFKNQNRIPPKVSSVIVHETVCSTWGGTVATLKQRGLGVHFIADHDGTIYQHADLLDDEMWHGTLFNGSSVGIETVNPYQPNLAPKTNSPWANVINAPWAVGGKYVVPTPEQAEAVCQLVNWLSSAAANPLTIPQLWPGLQNTHKMALGRIAADKLVNPGIHAHMYFDHADGAWLVLYAWLRLEPGLDAPTAYKVAMELATGASGAGVDLENYFTLDPFLTS